MAEHVNGKNDPNGTLWTGDIAKSRYEAYCIQYKKAKRWQCSTASNTSGNGITVGDIKRGVDTIDKKLETKCQFFVKMDALFGERPNVMPSHIMEVGGQDNGPHEANHQRMDVPTFNAFDLDDSDGECDSAEDEITSEHEDDSGGENTVGSNRYWAACADEDPGKVYISEVATKHPPQFPSQRQKRKGTSLPREFPQKKKATNPPPKKDLVASYTDMQKAILAFDREKFEYQKEQDRLARAEAQANDLRISKAKLIGQLVAQGITDPEAIKMTVDIAFSSSSSE
ncbi:hypothetical protein AC1031_013812 [Aphanomyces cochlioides]|nr:hypothetical protein AC1031_013812 [Aphanomyces cochlioides]